MVEAFYIGTIGSIIGSICGGTVSAILERVGFDITTWAGGVMGKLDVPLPFIGRVLYPEFNAAILVGSLLFGIMVALLAVLYPALKSVKMQPVEAFRANLKV